MNTFYRRRVRNFTILTDILILNLAFIVAYYLRYELQWIQLVLYPEPYQEWVGQQTIFVCLNLLLYAQARVWQRRRGEFFIDEMARITVAAATAFALMGALSFFVQIEPFSRGLYIWAFFLTILFTGIARVGRRITLNILYQRGIGVDKVIVIGSGEVSRGVIRTFLARPDLGFRTIGYLDDGQAGSNIGSGRIPRLGSWDTLATILQKHPNIYTVFIALPATLHEETLRLVRVCQNAGIRPQVVPDLFELSLSRIEFTNMAGLPIFSVRDLRMSWWGKVFKRALDLSISLAITLPVAMAIAILAIIVKLDSPGPAFFAQERVGKDGKLFIMYKLRSMIINAEAQKETLQAMNEADGPLFKIREDPRLTRSGRLLRRLSLDELPQLWNVLKGEMSLVGPRPPLQEEVDKYQAWHRQRLSVKGGITGLWQVSGRSDLTFDEQCLLDIYYIENWSLSFDLRLILQTIPHALTGHGAY